MSPWKIIGWVLLVIMLMSLTFCGLVCVRVADTNKEHAAQAQLTAARPTPANCEPLAESAVSIMKARQNGADMAKVLKAVESTGNGAQVRQLVIDAYASPRFATEKHQTRAVDDFRNDTFLSCIKG